MGIRTIIRKVVSTVTGGPNFSPRQTVGINLRTFGRFEFPPTKVGVKLSMAPIVATVRQSPAINWLEILWGLSHINPGTNGRQDAGGNWVNPANANGNENGSYATLSEGTLLVAGTLRWDHAAQVNRPASLAISKVELLYYFDTLDFLLGVLSSWTLGWRVGEVGVPHNVTTASVNNVNHLTSPLIVDITADLEGVGGEGLTWATVASLQQFITGSIVVDAVLAGRIRVDAGKVRVTASETQSV